MWRAQLSRQLREIRIVSCQTGSASAGVRPFVEHHYRELQMLNPEFPLVFREVAGTQPYMSVRHANAAAEKLDISNLDKDAILALIERCVTTDAPETLDSAPAGVNAFGAAELPTSILDANLPEV